MHYLRRIGSTFFFRRRVPFEFLSVFPRPEIQIALKTTSPDQAKALAARLNKQFEDALFALRMGAKPDTVLTFLPKRHTKGDSAIPTKKNLCSILFQKFHLEMVTGGTWGAKTEFENGSCFSLFLRVIGDRDVTEVTHGLLLDFRDKLTRLPPNLNKNPNTIGKTIVEILAQPQTKVLSRVRVNRHLTVLSSFFKWLHRHEIVEKNPAANLLLPKARIRPDDERQRYTPQEIATILSLTAEFRETCPERYWVPLIAIYSGMRLNEICQLYIEDLRQEDDIWCFDINDGKDKRVKSLAGRRLIPIHPAIHDLGLLRYADLLFHAGQERLFPNLKNHGKNGYGHQVGQWFQLLNRAKVTSDPRKTFHSIRHTVADTLKQAGVEEQIIAEILGHGGGSITMTRYGKRFQPSVLLEALRNMSFGRQPHEA